MRKEVNGYYIGDQFIAVKHGVDVTKGRIYEVIGHREYTKLAYFRDDDGATRSVVAAIGRGELQLFNEAGGGDPVVVKPMQATEMRIVKASTSVWYAGLVGAVVTVKELDMHLYSVEGMRNENGVPFCIWREDVQPIEKGTI